MARALPEEKATPHPDCAISYQPLSATLRSIDVQALIDQAGDPWYNQTLIQVGDVGAIAGKPWLPPLPAAA